MGLSCTRGNANLGRRSSDGACEEGRWLDDLDERNRFVTQRWLGGVRHRAFMVSRYPSDPGQPCLPTHTSGHKQEVGGGDVDAGFIVTCLHGRPPQRRGLPCMPAWFFGPVGDDGAVSPRACNHPHPPHPPPHVLCENGARVLPVPHLAFPLFFMVWWVWLPPLQ